MRLMLIHTETCYFAGAQKMLGYFLDELALSEFKPIVAVADSAKMKSLIPSSAELLPLSSNQNFSPQGLWRQLVEIKKYHRERPVDLFHGWAARDWELTAITGFLAHRPTSGTLHDHPQAAFISAKRQKMMWGMSQFGLKRIVCVSDAVREACQQVGYPSSKLSVIHNGLPDGKAVQVSKSTGLIRLGYLGAFSERKGFRGLFEILEMLGHNSQFEWEIWLAGAAQSPEGENLLNEIRAKYCGSGWWHKVRWTGWTDRPMDFLGALDVLICPSSEFDPFPTVLLEAGKVGVPVVAARVGGVSEIVEDGKTGWTFEAGDWGGAAQKVEVLIKQRERLQEAGRAAQVRIDENFSARRMVEGYFNLFKTLI